MALAIFGLIIWAGGYATSGVVDSLDGGGSSSSRNWLGIVLALAVTVLGYIVAASARQGPLATAGVVASALGVPTALGFITFDAAGGSPVNIDAVFVVTIIVWLISYSALPGARGHAFYLGLSAIALWVYLVLKISPSVFGLPFELLARSAFGPGNIVGDDPSSDLSSLAAMSFVMAAAYYAIAFLLDREGRHGAATALVAAGFPVLVGGFIFAAHDFGQTGIGITLILVGFVLVLFGARARRRFTTWAWAAGIVLGVGILIAKASPDNDTAAGISFIVCGVGLTFIGNAIAAALGEREYPET
jgi:hypothetical protein